MSLYSALYAGVSGLSAQSAAMATVADNITNINTVGYKGTQAQFRTLVTGSTGASYTAGGVAAAPVSMISKAGLMQASDSSTDIAIDGGGFFVTRTTADPTTGSVAYTRAGSFKPDEEGYLRNASQLYLYGWRLDSQGNYTNTGSLNALEPVRLSDLTGTASPTTRLQVRANLQSDATTFAGVYNVGDMASGAVTPTFTRSFDIYDAQGGSHSVTMSFLKTGSNQWATEIYANPATDVTQAGGILASGTMKFNPDGSLDKAGSTTDPTSPSPLFGPLTASWTNGASSVPINLALGDDGGINGMTQFGGDGNISALISSNVDGGLLGNLASVTISKTGRVTAIFDDGSARDVFQLPIATFQNPDGLTRLSGNAYTGSRASGGVTLNEPGSLGAGNIEANALEASNVDLAGEFTNMIRFQRAYSASSKIITTVDDMLQELSNLKR